MNGDSLDQVFYRILIWWGKWKSSIFTLAVAITTFIVCINIAYLVASPLEEVDPIICFNASHEQLHLTKFTAFVLPQNYNIIDGITPPDWHNPPLELARNFTVVVSSCLEATIYKTDNEGVVIIPLSKDSIYQISFSNTTMGITYDYAYQRYDDYQVVIAPGDTL